ncbi:hypothetical protein Tco_0343437, partial [Tanacetum coccineum]
VVKSSREERNVRKSNIGDSDNTGDGGKIVGGAIRACGGIGERASEAKRSLVKSSKKLEEVFPGEAEKTGSLYPKTYWELLPKEILGATIQRDTESYYPKRYWELLPKERLGCLMGKWRRNLIDSKSISSERNSYVTQPGNQFRGTSVLLLLRINPEIDICTDIYKITRKPSKTEKHGHGERKSTKEAKDAKPKPGKGETSLKHSHWPLPTRRTHVDSEENTRGSGICSKLSAKEAQGVIITDCQASNPCALRYDPTAHRWHPMIE